VKNNENRVFRHKTAMEPGTIDCNSAAYEENSSLAETTEFLLPINEFTPP